MVMISSLSNPKVKHVRRLQSDRRFRSSQQQFVIEGTRWVQELLHDISLLQHIFYTETWLAQAGHDDLIIHSVVSKYVVSEEVMVAMSATEAPPGILATVDMNPLPLPEWPWDLLARMRRRVAIGLPALRAAHS